MIPPRLLRLARFTLGVALPVASAQAFKFTGSSWADGDIVMQLQLGAPSRPLADGAANWGVVAESALNEWNTQLGRAKFTVVRDSTAAIRSGNRINNIIFRADIYGEAFDSRTLAVTLGGSLTTAAGWAEQDVIFNSNRTWDSYRGPLRGETMDFRRVALHEFGHVLGLGHPDETSDLQERFQNVSAIMESSVSATETLRADDIAGVKALYDSAATRTVRVGESLTITLPVSGAGPFTFDWFFRAEGSPLVDPFHLGSTATYTIGSMQPTDAGSYIVTATSPAGVFFSTTTIVRVTPVATNSDTLLANISTRGIVGTGGDVMIAGLVINGTTPKTVLVRAAGPALGDFGVTGALADPALSIISSSNQQTVAQNDNWETGGAAAISAASTRLGAFQFKPGSRDAAVLATLPPGAYTAIVSGVGGTSGVALVEAYDADPDAATARTRRLVNIATRGQVATGENVLIAGLVVSGPGPRTFLIRAIGPTLGRAPFNVAGALRDPFLQIYQGDRLLHENDDWDSPFAAQPALRAAAQRVGAFALQELRNNSGLDAAILITLEPGSYTAKVSGFEGATGIALVEVYEIP